MSVKCGEAWPYCGAFERSLRLFGTGDFGSGDLIAEDWLFFLGVTVIVSAFLSLRTPLWRLVVTMAVGVDER